MENTFSQFRNSNFKIAILLENGKLVGKVIFKHAEKTVSCSIICNANLLDLSHKVTATVKRSGMDGNPFALQECLQKNGKPCEKPIYSPELYFKTAYDLDYITI